MNLPSLKIGLCSLALVLSSACVPSLYRLDVPQGNVILDSDVSQLRRGMTREQVFNIMGTPLQRAAVSPDRWIYVSSEQKAGDPATVQRVELIFANDRLEQVVRN